MDQIDIGTRVLYNFSNPAVVRFIGRTEFSNKILYGIEFDAPNGNSNGSMYGKSYFTCKEKHGYFACRSQLKVVPNSRTEIPETQSIKKPEIINENNQKNTFKETPEAITEIPETRPVAINNITDENNRIKNENEITKSIRTRGSIVPPKVLALDKENQRFGRRTALIGDNSRPLIIDTKAPLKSINEDSNQLSKVAELSEQLSALKLLKKKDREKLMETEKLLKIANQTIEELRKELEKIKKEFEEYRYLMQSTEEDIEMAAIDKEMAETKLEQQQQEMEILRVELKRLQNENALLKDGPESLDTKQFLAQTELIEKYKKGILDLSNALNILKDDNENKNSELEIIREINICQESELEQLKSIISQKEIDLKEMKEVVDSTSDVERLLENLTFKNENLEHEAAKQRQVRQELEDREDQLSALVESQSRDIVELKRELNNATRIASEMKRATEIKTQMINELTSAQEALYQRINELIIEADKLRSEVKIKSELVEKSKEYSRRLSIINYQQHNSQQIDVSRAIEDKLAKINLEDRGHHIRLLYQYLPVTFSITGGESDAISLVLLVNRLTDKVSIINDYISQQKLSYCPQGNSDSNILKPTESSCILTEVKLLLVILVAILRQIRANIDTCSPDSLHTLCSTKLEMLRSQESSIELVIDQIKKQCMNVNRNVSMLLESIQCLQQLYFDRFRNQLVDCGLKLKGFFTIIDRGCDCFLHHLIWINDLMKNNNISNPRLEIFFAKLKEICVHLQSKIKSVFLSLQQFDLIKLNVTLSKSIDDSIDNFKQIIITIFQFALELNDYKIQDNNAMVKLCDLFEKSSLKMSSNSETEIISLLSSIDKFAVELADNFNNGLYDIKKPINRRESSIDLSAALYRDKFLKLQCLSKEIQIRDEKLQLANKDLSNKSEVLALANLQIDYLKKKLDSAIDIRDRKIEQMEKSMMSITVTKQTESSKCEYSQICVNNTTNETEKLSTSKLSIEDVVETMDSVGQSRKIQILSDACVYLNSRLGRMKSYRAENTIVRLKPLNVQNHKTSDDISQQVMKAHSLSRKLCTELTTIKIPDLSSTIDTKMFPKRIMKCAAIRNEFAQLKAETEKIVHRRSYVPMFC